MGLGQKNKGIYLDYQSTTPVHKEVADAMLPYLSEMFANPNASEHFMGWESSKAVERGRLNIATALNCDNDEIIFTSGATEANNLAIKGFLDHFKMIGKTTILVSSIEHKCVLRSAERVKEQGFSVKYIPPDAQGIITPDKVLEQIDESVALVSVMLVNNEIGTIQPIPKIAEIAHQYGALVHTDAVQAPSFMQVSLTELSADLLSLSGHKLYGPKGIGCLYVNRNIRQLLKPLFDGGNQEAGSRSGTLPTPLCVGLGKAVELAASGYVKNAEHLQTLSDYFFTAIKSEIPNITVNGSLQKRHPGNLNLCFPDIDARNFLQMLQPNIAASTGSACSSGTESPSYVLQEIGLTAEKAASSIRFSFGAPLTHEDLDAAVNTILAKYRDTSLIAA